MAFYVDSDDATLREMCELGEDVLKEQQDAGPSHVHPARRGDEV